MPRPCDHDPIQPNNCLHCGWLVSDNERGREKRAQWGEDESHVIKRATTEVKAPPPRVCKFFGKPTGKTAVCPSCRGKVELKLFECQIHGACTPGKSAPGVACCKGCKQYQGRE